MLFNAFLLDGVQSLRNEHQFKELFIKLVLRFIKSEYKMYLHSIYQHLQNIFLYMRAIMIFIRLYQSFHLKKEKNYSKICLKQISMRIVVEYGHIFRYDLLVDSHGKICLSYTNLLCGMIPERDIFSQRVDSLSFLRKNMKSNES